MPATRAEDSVFLPYASSTSPQKSQQPQRIGSRPDMREVQQQGGSRTIQPGGNRARSPQQVSQGQGQRSSPPRSISPLQAAYHPDPRYQQQQARRSPSPNKQSYNNSQQHQASSQYPPPRPHLQVSITAPKDPFIDPPRAAFAAPPSPTLSAPGSPGSPGGLSPKNLHHSPSTQSLTGSTISKSDPDNDRLAPARIAGDGQDFWKRFSMVAHEAEFEKKQNKLGKDPWLSKEFRGSRKFKYSVWAIGLICIAAIAGGLAWHFTHDDGSSGLKKPTQHDFGLGGTSSVVRTGINGGMGGGRDSPATPTRPAPSLVGAAVAAPDADIADIDEEEGSTTAAPVRRTTSPAITSTSTRARSTTLSSVTSRATIAKRMHRQRRI